MVRKTSAARKGFAGQGYNAGTLVASASWRDGYNPTRRLTVERAVWLMECYSRGMFSELMWLFAAPFLGLETKDPVYMPIIERRVAAVRQMDWSVRVDEADAFDPAAERQRRALEDAYNRIGNLGKAIEALEIATFRGFAHLAILPGELRVVQPWNVARDGSAGAWRFNPEAQDCGFEVLGAEMDMDPAQHVVREVARPVGAFALVKWLRCNLSEKDWDAFIEIYGIPAWLIVGPPNIPADQVDAYRQAAEKVAKGGSGYLPNGSSAQCADAPRAVAPFEPRLRYLNEMLVLAGTGGMLTMLAEPGSGTLAGSAHADAFKTLAKMDATDISECLQRQFDRRVLEAAGFLLPGERAKAWFTLDWKSEPDNEKVCAQVKTLHDAGLDVDAAQVEELTGFRCVRREERPAGTRPGAAGDLPTLGPTEGKLPTLGPSIANEGSPRSLLRGVKLPMVGKNAEDLPKIGKDEEALARALQKDLRPVGKALATALARGEGPGELFRRLERILAECGTESADVLERAMRSAGTAALANMTDRNGREHADAGSPESGQFLPKGGGASHTPTSGLEVLIKDDGDGLDEAGKAELRQGQASAEKALATQADVFGAMTDPELGTIDFRWASNDRGIHHIIERRNAYKANHPDAPSGEDVVRAIPSVIVRGERHTEGVGLRADTIIEYGGNRVILTPSHDGKPSNRWVLSSYDINPDAAGYRHKNGRGVSGEGVNSSGTTRRKPTGASSSAGSASSSPQYTTPHPEGKEET